MLALIVAIDYSHTVYNMMWQMRLSEYIYLKKKRELVSISNIYTYMLGFIKVNEQEDFLNQFTALHELK